MIVNGFTTERILQYSADEWNLGTRQAFNYIAKADKRIGESAAVDRDYEIGKAIRRLNHLYSACVVSKRYSDALRTQAEINKLFGLYEPQRVRHEGELAGLGPSLVEGMGKDELEGLVRKLDGVVAGAKPRDTSGPH